MTRTVARSLFSWKTLKKAGSVARISTPKRKGRENAYGPSRNACGPQNRCESTKESVLLLQNFNSFKMRVKGNILTANFTILANCPMQNYSSRQLTPKAQKVS